MASAGLIKRSPEASLPGPTIESSRIDEDGVVVQILKTRKLRSAITEGKLSSRECRQKPLPRAKQLLLLQKWLKVVAVPGNTLVAFTIDDRDGAPIEVDRIMVHALTITPSGCLLLVIILKLSLSRSVIQWHGRLR